jgi:hypothetical protein
MKENSYLLEDKCYNKKPLSTMYHLSTLFRWAPSLGFWANGLAGRVTRLAEFNAKWTIVYSGQSLLTTMYRSSQVFSTFSTKSNDLILIKRVVLSFGRFLTSSSGHPACCWKILFLDTSFRTLSQSSVFSIFLKNLFIIVLRSTLSDFSMYLILVLKRDLTSRLSDCWFHFAP